MTPASSVFMTEAIAPMPPITGWEEFFDEGRDFLRAAANAHGRRAAVFTPEILYNLIAMAIEKFVMAALMRHGALPYNHTMTDLVAAANHHLPGLVRGLENDLLALDAYQEICDLEGYRVTPPSAAEIPAMVELARCLGERAAEACGIGWQSEAKGL